MSDVDIPVVSVEVLSPPSRRAQNLPFRTEVRYHLADGTHQDSHFTTQRKKDALPYAEKLDLAAKAHKLTAGFNDGKFWGTTQTFHLC